MTRQRPAVAKLRVTIVDPRRDGATIRRMWAQVADRNGATELAHDVEWFWENMEWFSPPARALRFLIVSDCAQPVAVLPLEQRGVTAGPLSIPALGFIHHPATPAGAALILPEDHDAVGDAFAACLGEQYRSWRCLSLEGLESGSTWERTVRRKLAPSAIMVERAPVPESYMEIDGSWQEFLTRRSHNFRNQLRSDCRRLQSLGCAYGERVGETALTVDALEQIDRKSWRIDKRESWEKNESLLRYCHSLSELYPPSMRILRCLVLDGQPIAGFFGLRHGDVLHAIKLNYDRAHERYSPGKVLLADVYRECFDMGVTRVELLAHTEFAHRMANATRHRSKALIFNRRSWGGLILGSLLRFVLAAKRRWTERRGSR